MFFKGLTGDSGGSGGGGFHESDPGDCIGMAQEIHMYKHNQETRTVII